MTENSALEGRVSRLENAVTNGFTELKSMLRQEISDLKDEQIKDLREANRRIADDQRRLWDVVAELQKREHERVGTNRSFSILVNFISAIIGGAIAAVATWLSDGRHP